MFVKDGRQERRTGRGGRQKTVEPGPERDLPQAPGPAIAEGDVIPAGQSQAASRQRRLVWTWIGLAAATRVLRDRRFEAAVITSVLVLVAVTKLSWEDLVRDIRRLIAWEDRQAAELEKKPRRQGKA